MKVHAIATDSPHAPFGPRVIERREPRADDVVIDVLFCGICHSDVHQARDEWGHARFPMVPGHEIVGRVAQIGAAVTRFAPGALVGVGCMVDSCRTCAQCEADHQQFCEAGCAWTYNSTEMDRETPTYGGYSTRVVVSEAFVLRVPDNLDPAGAAPLLCAGVTTWSPLRQWHTKPGDEVAVVGLGGLGHMAVKLAAAMGARVTMFSTSPDKEADAQRLGAAGFALSTAKDTFKRLRGRFDLIIDTISAPHDYNQYLGLLKAYGAMVVLGMPPVPSELSAGSLISGNKRLAGSLIGGVAETQAMLDFCGEHGVVSDVEVVSGSEVDTAYERMVRGDVRYRFVIDASTLGGP